MADIHKPKTVGRYRRGEKIGHGSFGVVYKGVDTRTNRVVAIKTLDLDTVTDEVENVKHEVELLSHLSKTESSNVTKYFGTVLEGSKLWIIMDLCSGGSVQTLLRAGIPDDRYLSVLFREITTGVVAIHSQGIIHRDIKAANVLITMAGQVKLCDFGVAANISLSRKDKRKSMAGTPLWMAPEVITEGQSYTNKADIWSLGVTFFEIATGHPPHQGLGEKKAMMMITNERPARLEGPNYTPALKDLVALCLDEDPEARPSAEDLLKHKFIKQYAKTPTGILRELVNKYIAWKKAHKDHRDSVLDFNPFAENKDDEGIALKDDAISIAPSTRDSDTDSVWDFNVTEEFDETIDDGDNPAPREDLSDAPASLRELFGVPDPKESIAPPRAVHRAVTETSLPRYNPAAGLPSGGSMTPTVAQFPRDGLGFAQSTGVLPGVKPPMGTNTPRDEHTHGGGTHSGAGAASGTQSGTHSETYTGPARPEPAEPTPFLAIPDMGQSLHAPGLHSGSSQGPSFVFPPPSKPHSDLSRSSSVVGRSRSTTVDTSNFGLQAPSLTGGGGGASPATSSSSFRALDHPKQGSHSQSSSNVWLDAPGHDHSSVSPTPAATSSPSTSPSPKRSGGGSGGGSGSGGGGTTATIGRRQVAPELKTRVQLPRLQMPPRNGVQPFPLMSAPAAPGKHMFMNEPVSAGGVPAPLSWPSEFPPMPKIDTNVLLDSTPDEILVDHLLELTVGFKTAIGSLANQFEAEKL